MGLTASVVGCWHRTAARATLALFPLFGLTGILFSIEPKASVSILAYRIVNAVLQSSQVSHSLIASLLLQAGPKTKPASSYKYITYWWSSNVFIGTCVNKFVKSNTLIATFVADIYIKTLRLSF